MDFPTIYDHGFFRGSYRVSFTPVILVSLAFHLIFLFGLVYLTRTFYKSREFDRPQTFQLVRLSAVFEEAPAQPQQPPLAKALPRPRIAAAGRPVSQPRQVAPAPEQNPVPAKQEPVGRTTVAAAAPAPAQAGGPASTPLLSPDMVYDEKAADEPLIVLKKSDPFYPEFVQDQGIQGVVQAQLIIDKDGNVSQITIIKSPHELLSEEVTKALTRYKFKPAKVKGVPVKIRAKIEMEFKL